MSVPSVESAGLDLDALDLTDAQVRMLAETFQRLLPAAVPGDVAYARFLPGGVIRTLLAHPHFDVPQWDVYGVGQGDSPSWIRGERAVELREEKRRPLLLLVDESQPDAGMDGIFSAGRELDEKHFFDDASRHLASQVGRRTWELIKQAKGQARRLGAIRPLPPWQEFLFQSQASDHRALGRAMAWLGLWPVRADRELTEKDIEEARKLSARLLMEHSALQSAPERVAALLLHEPTTEQNELLTEASRLGERQPAHLVTMQIATDPRFQSIWLGQMTIGVFDPRELAALSVDPWRSDTKNALGRWCGLEDRGGELHYVIDAEHPEDSKRLTVRWRVKPVDLPKGFVDYQVEIRSGTDILASKSVSHRDKSVQDCRFLGSDFQIDEGDKFFAEVVVRAGHFESPGSEQFMVYFGQAEASPAKTAKANARTMVEGLATCPTRDAFLELAERYGRGVYSEQAGVIRAAAPALQVTVAYPPLLKVVEQDWHQHGGAVGRWQVRVRSDGELLDHPTFVPIAPGREPSGNWSRVETATRLWAETLKQGPSVLAWVPVGSNDPSEYVNAWAAVLEGSDPDSALAFTVEVQDADGACRGLIVLPMHPLRVAWQHAFAKLVDHVRYEGSEVAAKELPSVLAPLDGANFPMFMPGPDKGQAFVFGDALDFNAVAMIFAEDPDPTSTVALFATMWNGGDVGAAASVSARPAATADLVAEQLKRYRELNPEYHTLKVLGVKTGNGAALAHALKAGTQNVADEDPSEEESPGQDVAVELDLLVSADADNDLIGQFFSRSNRLRRQSKSDAADHRWMNETISRRGNRSVPRFTWAKRDGAGSMRPAHVGIVFHPLTAAARLTEGVPPVMPLHAYGLYQPVATTGGGADRWDSWLPAPEKGQKHPVARLFSDRVIRLQTHLTLLTALRMGGAAGAHPVLTVAADRLSRQLLQNLHDACDWVVTVDRHLPSASMASIAALRGGHRAVIVDRAPERADLSALQLVTSTAKADGLEAAFAQYARDLGVSVSSEPGSPSLLEDLKAVSGRTAIRLASPDHMVQRAIGLAVFYRFSREYGGAADPWPFLGEGFFIPHDEVQQILGEGIADTLAYVKAGRGGLRVSFFQVEFVRYMLGVHRAEQMETSERAFQASTKAWQRMLAPNASSVVGMLNRMRLGQLIQFYAEQALDTGLDQEAYQRIQRSVADLIASEGDVSAAVELTGQNQAIIFSPEFQGEQPMDLGDGAMWLCSTASGPTPALSKPADVRPPEPLVPEISPPQGTVPEESLDGTEGQPQEAVAVLGTTRAGERVDWHVSTKSNPHLMVVGLPGMGKTTALINITAQLAEQGVIPIVFSYHDDMDEKLGQRLDPLSRVTYQSLGFNPMIVPDTGSQPYVDNVGMIRDIFGAIFPELGDVQLGQIREALKQSYQEHGWSLAQRGPIPKFRRFFDILKTSPKPDNGIMQRLGELADYDLFEAGGPVRSLLDDPNPVVVELHRSGNQRVQTAFALFVLHSLYQDMLARGTQRRITHAVIFDEAHKASKLHLLSTMAKEARKFGIAFILASQESRDFEESMYTAVGSYLALRVNESDAKVMAKVMAASSASRRLADDLKALKRYEGLFYSEGFKAPKHVKLQE
ncbi:MAG: hypothetical protein M0Z36_09700 [Thermaerobacter sp.]|nr:hypothetical protein [Thermaerobacter sp.]